MPRIRAAAGGRKNKGNKGGHHTPDEKKKQKDDHKGPGKGNDSESEEEADGGTPMERCVFGWVYSRKGYKTGQLLPPEDHETITSEEIIKKYGVPRYLLMDSLQKEIDESNGCKSLPFTLLLVVSYSFMVIGHMNAPVLRDVEDSIGFDISDNANFAFDSEWMAYKGIEDIGGFGDIWSFMNIGLVPLMFKQEYAWSEDILERNQTSETPLVQQLFLTDKQKGMISTYNRIVGGVRLRQERSTEERCTTAPELAALWNRKCLTHKGDKWYDLEPDRQQGISTPYPDETYTRWLWVHESEERMAAKLREWELENWLDPLTYKMEIGIPIYNAEYGVHALVTVNFYFSRGGHIWKSIISQAGYADWMTQLTHWFWDGVFIGAILWVLFTELVDIILTMKDNGVRAIWTEYISFFNLIDWISVFTGVVVVVIMIETAFISTPNLNAAAAKVGDMKPFDHNLEDLPEVREYIDVLRENVELVTLLQSCMTFYPLIIVFRLFKAFHAQQRLAIVTNTMKESLMDLSHFLVVFVCVFLSFATSGMVLFGREVEEFATFPRAGAFCVRLLFGDIDFDSMKNAGRDVAGTWLILFLLLAVLLLLNMLLAIIMDSYSAVSERSGDSPSLLQEIVNVIKNMLLSDKDKPIPTDQIMKALQEADLSTGTKKALKQAKTNRARTTAVEAAGGTESWALEGLEDHTDHDPSNMRTVHDPIFDGNAGDLFDMQMQMDAKAAKSPSVTRWNEMRKEAIANTGQDAAWKRQLMTPADIIEAVYALPLTGRQKTRWKMKDEQAEAMLEKAIEQFYEMNRRPSEMFEAIRVLRKIQARSRKILNLQEVASQTPAADKMGSMESDMVNTLTSNVDEDAVEAPFEDPEDPSTAMTAVRKEVVHFLEDAQADRAQAAATVERLRAEVRALRNMVQEVSQGGSLAWAANAEDADDAVAAPKPGIGLMPKKTKRLSPLEVEPPGGNDDMPEGLVPVIGPPPAGGRAQDHMALLPIPEGESAPGLPRERPTGPAGPGAGRGQGALMGSYTGLLQRHGFLPMDYWPEEPSIAMPTLEDEAALTGVDMSAGEAPIGASDMHIDLEETGIASRLGGAKATGGAGLRASAAAGHPSRPGDAAQMTMIRDEFTSFREAQDQIRQALQRRRTGADAEGPPDLPPM
eukprot:TRINITY_DN91520_c0_g1_i1.p1 TRINITY_DN91520_c0_g1~~TRINITY_DN91520_c0_g1_i1.p1  ORF type:complete len:1155 (-),score=290.49 TRINITY_DN91520_c0_g1_i1:126-3590(-)